MKKQLALLLVLGLWPLAAFAQDDALNARDSVPAGERLAIYLQSYFNTFSSLESLKSGSDAPAEPLKANIFYNPQAELITVLVVGSLSDPEAAKPILTTALKLLMQSAKTVKNNYGFTLADKDFALVYFSAATRKSILTLKAGVWTDPQAAADTQSSQGTPSPSETPTRAVVPDERPAP